MDTLWQDAQYALRTWRNAPGFTTIVILTLAFGIAANTVVFTVINTVFLNPLPVTGASELVSVRATNRGSSATSGEALQISYSNLKDFRERNQVFTSLAAHTTPVSLTMLRGTTPERMFAEFVTGDYFTTLGLHPARGRFFEPSDDAVPGRGAVAVLAYGAWQRRFGSDPSLIGTTINLNGIAFTIIGVAPERFLGVNAVFGPDVWIPSMMMTQTGPASMRDWLTNRNAPGFRAVGRLEPGVTPAQASANLAAIAMALEREYPEQNRGRSVAVDPLTRAVLLGPSRLTPLMTSLLLILVPALLLLIACSNVASLLLARAAARTREVATRLALGAGRTRLLRQLLTESVLLAVVSGVAGFAIAYAGARLLWSFRPAEWAHNLLDMDIDLGVLMFTAVVSVATGIIFGIAPAWQSTRADLAATLNVQTHAVGGTRRRVTLGRLLLVGQVALSLVSLVIAGLLLRSVQQAYRIDPGFESRRLAIVLVGVGQAGYDRARSENFHREVRTRLSAVPGVAGVSWATTMPLFARPSRSLTIEGHELRPGDAPPTTIVSAIGVDYFATTGISLARGRAFSEADREDSPPVAIINEAAATRYWPDGDPIGRRLRLSGEDVPRQIVGVSRTVNYTSLGESPQLCVYVPLPQQFSESATLHIRTQGDPAGVLRTVQQELRAIDQRVEANDVRTMRTLIAQSLFGVTIGVGLLGVFGIIALALASLGLYGALAHAVRERQREIAVRMALGAGRRSVIGLILREGFTVVGVGLSLGLASSLLIGRALTTVLFGVTPADPIAIGMAALVLLATTACACYLPAWHASRLEPLRALREN
jgi:putative ABC transport system permease protein